MNKKKSAIEILMNIENSLIKKNTLENWAAEKYIHNAKFRAIVDFIFNLIATEQITPFELSQACKLAFLMFEVRRPAPYPFKIPYEKLINVNNEK